MEDKIEKLYFYKIPKNIPEWSEMIGHTYKGYYSEFGKGYVLLCGETKEAEKAYQNTIYKTLIASGEDEEFARTCAYEGEDPGMCLYFDKECFKMNK